MNPLWGKATKGKGDEARGRGCRPDKGGENFDTQGELLDAMNSIPFFLLGACIARRFCDEELRGKVKRARGTST